MSAYSNVFQQFERGFFGSCVLGILVLSCLGGVTAMYILENGNSLVQMLQLFMVVAACLTFNGSILSMQKPKVVFDIFITSIVICTVLLVANTL